MIRWYKDIYPCDACVNGPMVGSRCRKGHHTTHADGCSDCGTLVNMEWYYEGKECKDFERLYQNDPSGS